jgi:glycosyltransferase involved in cell wall biosynthesis
MLMGADSGPNYDSVMWFLEKVWPGLARRFPTARFVVAGLNRSKRLTEEPLPERVVVTRRLPDLSPVYSAARVFVAPTRASSGIPLKIIEAAGYGVPVVATSLLAGQLSWKVPTEISTADNPEEFMDACSLLFRDRVRWEDQRQAALQRIQRDYSQATFSRQVRSALNLLAAESH